MGVKAVRHSIDFIKQKFLEKNCILLSAEYFNAFQKLDYLCPKKHISKISWNSLRVCKKFYCQQCKLESFATKEHPSYNKLLTNEQRKNNDFMLLSLKLEWKQWRQKVFLRDNYKCRKCNSNKNLNPHHIYNFSKYKNLRYKKCNGITLCKICHTKFHSKQKYGKKNNNLKQIKEFLFQ